MRGTFANIRIRNLMVPGVEGGVSLHWPDGDTASIYEVAMRYQAEGVPLVVLAGKEYGTGSSRDWAAKGPALLGVRAVIAQSFERIHRSNLVGMGILPLQFMDGDSVASLGLTGHETYDIEVANDVKPGDRIRVTATRPDGAAVTFEAVARLDTPVEVDYYRNGGILKTVMAHLVSRP
jgi:aconitate hydratase